MRFSIASVLALATAALAQREPTAGFNVITKPTKGEQVSAGSTYEIVWQPDSTHPGEIEIGLLGGSSPGTLAVIDTIASGVDATTGSYSWEVPATLGDLATYGIMISLASDEDIFQYGFPFEIVGGSSDGGDDESTSTTGTATGSDSTTATATGTTTTEESDSTSTTFTLPTITSTTARGNLSTTAGNQQTTVTTVVNGNQPTTTTALTTSVHTDAAASFAAGSIAMLGGVAMAVLAL